MVAFLTTWSLIDGIAESWKYMFGLSESSRDPSEDAGGIVPAGTTVCPDSSELLSRRMRALGFNANEVVRIEPGILLDLHSKCTRCDSWAQCELDLGKEKPDRSDDRAWQDYCPNVATLKMLKSLLSATWDVGPDDSPGRVVRSVTDESHRVA